MPVSTFDYEDPLSAVLQSNTVSLTSMQANPLTTPYAAGFEQFQGKLLALMAQEALISIEVTKVTARITVADEALGDYVDVVSRTALIATNGETAVPLYALFFDNKTPSLIKRPRLGSKLARLRGWVSHLNTSGVPALVALAPEVEAAVNEADLAVKALADAKLKEKEFHTVGARRAAIDEFNALRKSTYGAIAELPHKYPEKNLPNTFAERFFRHEMARKGGKKALTSTALADLITEEEAKLADLKQRHQNAIAREAEATKTSAKTEAIKTEIDLAEKAASEAAAKVAALKAKLSTTT
jgi:hypothetical protein